MQGRDQTRRRQGALLTAIGALAIAALPASAAAGPQSIDSKQAKLFSAKTAGAGDATKSGNKGARVRTGSRSVGFSSGTTADGKARCPSKTHMTGGGYAVAPPFTPVPPTGLRTLPTGSVAGGKRTWESASSAFSIPAATGTLTTYVRCEGSALGTLTTKLKGSVSLESGRLGAVNFKCPGGTRVLSGGFEAEGPTDPASTASFRVLMISSRRTSKRQWTLIGFNNGTPGTPSARLGGTVFCEADTKGTRISSVSETVPVADNARGSADPACKGKKHAVSSGFSISVGGNIAPVVAIDENHPVGRKGWHVGFYESPGATLPPGTAVTATTYCKRNSAK